MKCDTLIIGAGAAGLMCAYLSGEKGQKTIILDHSAKLAEKIRISGGGRCNFTNLYTEPSCYLSQNPHFSHSALSRYTPQHFIDLLHQNNLSFHEKTLGQLFCDQKSQAIINLLDYLCRKNNVLRHMETAIHKIEKNTCGFEVHTQKGLFQTEKLVIATGGLSIPQIGASSFGYDIARQFGLNIVETAPALVPLLLSSGQGFHCAELAGTSFFSKLSIGKTSFEENSLFTHRGLSGPAILQISSYWTPGQSISMDLLPQHSIVSEIETHRRSTILLSTLLARFFSHRLAQMLCQLLGWDGEISQMNKKNIQHLQEIIHHFQFSPSGSEGYKKAEVTRGGVSTQDLNSKTMMAKAIEGLYFIGEVVDVTGWLGGYNFQWAWSSAYAAAQSF